MDNSAHEAANGARVKCGRSHDNDNDQPQGRSASVCSTRTSVHLVHEPVPGGPHLTARRAGNQSVGCCIEIRLEPSGPLESTRRLADQRRQQGETEKSVTKDTYCLALSRVDLGVGVPSGGLRFCMQESDDTKFLARLVRECLLIGGHFA